MNREPMNRGAQTSPPPAKKYVPDFAEFPKAPVSGWPLLAQIMGDNPAFTVFSTFKDLNIKSLLYYQAELDYLREGLHEAEWEDHRSNEDEDRSSFANNLGALFEVKNGILFNLKDGNRDRVPPEPLPRQWELITQIRSTLKEYNAALIQYSQLNTLPRADEQNIGILRNLVRDMDTVNMGSLRGPGTNTWTYEDSKSKPLPSLGWQILRMLVLIFWTPRFKETKADLVLMADIDPATRSAFEFSSIYHRFEDELLFPLQKRGSALLHGIGKLLHCIWYLMEIPLLLLHLRHDNRDDPERATGPSLPTTTTLTSSDTATEPAKSLRRQISGDRSMGHRIATIRSAVTTLAACLLPTAAIAILSSLHKTATLIAVLGALTLVFAIGLMFFTSKTPTRLEIFGATAAFSAVLVVFVQSQISP